MIYLTGGAGVPNYGDELIVDAWLRWYIDEQGLPAQSVKASGSFASIFERLFSDRYPGLRTSGALRTARIPSRALDFPGIARAGYTFLEGDSDAVRALREDLSGAEVFHLHGGGYLNRTWPEHVFNAGVGAWLRENTGITLVGTGLGFGPLPDYDDEDLSILRTVFSAFDVLEVRDRWSHEYLLRNGVHESPVLGVDDAFLCAPMTRRVGGSVLHVSMYTEALVEEFAAGRPPGFVESFDRVMFWICTNADAAVFAAFARHVISAEPLSLDSLIAGVPVGDSNHMLSARFHPHLVGARLGMSGGFWSKSPYYDVKHGSLVSAGSPFRLVDLPALGPASVAAQEPMTGHDAELVERKRDLARRFLPAVPTPPDPAPPSAAGTTARRAGSTARDVLRRAARTVRPESCQLA